MEGDSPSQLITDDDVMISQIADEIARRLRQDSAQPDPMIREIARAVMAKVRAQEQQREELDALAALIADAVREEMAAEQAGSLQSEVVDAGEVLPGDAPAEPAATGRRPAGRDRRRGAK